MISRQRRAGPRALAFVLILGTSVGLRAADKNGFADSLYVGFFNYTGDPFLCPDQLVASLPLTIKDPSRVLANAAAIYKENASNLPTVAFFLVLENASGTVVAVSNETVAYVAGPNGTTPFSVGGVLQAGADPIPATLGQDAAFVAAPGSYTLKLIFSPGGSPCNNGLLNPITQNIALTYQLAGTKP